MSLPWQCDILASLLCHLSVYTHWQACHAIVISWLKRKTDAIHHGRVLRLWDLELHPKESTVVEWLASGISKPGVPGSSPSRGTSHGGVPLGKAHFLS